MGCPRVSVPGLEVVLLRPGLCIPNTEQEHQKMVDKYLAIPGSLGVD